MLAEYLKVHFTLCINSLFYSFSLITHSLSFFLPLSQCLSGRLRQARVGAGRCSKRRRSTRVGARLLPHVCCSAPTATTTWTSTSYRWTALARPLLSPPPCAASCPATPSRCRTAPMARWRPWPGGDALPEAVPLPWADWGRETPGDRPRSATAGQWPS